MDFYPENISNFFALYVDEIRLKRMVWSEVTIQMKGVPSNNVHYEYKIDRRKDRLFSTFIPPQQIEDDGGKIIGELPLPT